MPPLSRYFVKAALLYLVAGLMLGAHAQCGGAPPPRLELPERRDERIVPLAVECGESWIDGDRLLPRRFGEGGLDRGVRPFGLHLAAGEGIGDRDRADRTRLGVGRR